MIVLSFVLIKFLNKEDFHPRVNAKANYNNGDNQQMKTSEKSSTKINRKEVFKKFANEKKILSRFQISEHNKVTTKGLSSDKLIVKLLGTVFR